MRIEKEAAVRSILNILEESQEPLETKEIENLVKGSSRVKILYRLIYLRGEGTIKGKQVGSGKGTWIWWKNHDSKNKQFEKGGKN